MTARRISLVVLLGFVCSIGVCSTTAAQDDKVKDKEIAWFDMNDCDICKNFASMKHSMHKIKWENHLLDDGMISVSAMPEDMKDEMDKAKANMQKTIAKLEQGEQVDMCGHCHMMGKMMGLGAKFKQLETVGVEITIVTSSDPEVVKQIHAFAKKSKIEHDKMLEKIKMGKD